MVGRKDVSDDKLNIEVVSSFMNGSNLYSRNLMFGLISNTDPALTIPNFRSLGLDTLAFELRLQPELEHNTLGARA